MTLGAARRPAPPGGPGRAVAGGFRTARRAAPIAAAAVAALALAGCVETTRTSDGRPPTPEPVRPAMTPTEAPINAVVVIAGPPVDTNGNLWRDRIDVTVYLFARPHDMPTFREGSIEFAIYTMGGAGSPSKPGTPLRSWTFDAEELLSRRAVVLFGPCYQVSLSLLADKQDDRLPVEAVDLTAVFTAPGRDPVWAEGVTTIQLGKVPTSAGRGSRPAS